MSCRCHVSLSVIIVRIIPLKALARIWRDFVLEPARIWRGFGLGSARIWRGCFFDPSVTSLYLCICLFFHLTWNLAYSDWVCTWVSVLCIRNALLSWTKDCSFIFYLFFDLFVPSNWVSCTHTHILKFSTLFCFAQPDSLFLCLIFATFLLKIVLFYCCV